MTTTDDPRAGGPAAAAAGWGWAAAATAALVAILPFLAEYAAGLWIRPHYQFFPLALLGAGVLAYTRLRGVRAGGGRPGVAAVGLAAAWLVLAAAELLSSWWLACLAGMTLIPALGYAVGGWAAVRGLLPAWLMLWVIIPPPLHLDRTLILNLQATTTAWSSAALDALGIYHVTAGNVIEVDGRKLMVEQACSGVNSLFSLVACTLFLVLLTRRGPWRGSVLLVAAVGWVLAANVARVVGTVWLETGHGVHVSTGWRHEAFGLLLFAAAVGLLLSTDRLLAFFAGPVAGKPTPTPAPVSETRVAGSWVLASVAALAFLGLAAVHWAAPAADRTAVQVLPLTPDQDLLPERVGGWVRKDYSTHDREAMSFYGEHSQTWVYTRGETTALVSLDYPFPDWHDLTWCYTGQGWKVEEQTVGELPDAAGGYVEVRMVQPAFRHGYLVFGESDRQGRALRARPGGPMASIDRHQTTLTRLKSRLGVAAGPPPDPPGPVYQLQAFSDGYARLSGEDEAAVRALYAAARERVRTNWAAGP